MDLETENSTECACDNAIGEESLAEANPCGQVQPDEVAPNDSANTSLASRKNGFLNLFSALFATLRKKLSSFLGCGNGVDDTGGAVRGCSSVDDDAIGLGRDCGGCDDGSGVIEGGCSNADDGSRGMERDCGTIDDNSSGNEPEVVEDSGTPPICGDTEIVTDDRGDEQSGQTLEEFWQEVLRNDSQERPEPNNTTESPNVDAGADGTKELIWSIATDTSSVPLMDRFEKCDGQGNRVYDRLVVRREFYFWNGDFAATGDYVIERLRSGESASGNITFTEFKQRKTSALKSYTTEQVLAHLDELRDGGSQFVKFATPFLFRAQTSKNRRYGGWNHGTLYGETTRYGIVGVKLVVQKVD